MWILHSKVQPRSSKRSTSSRCSPTPRSSHRIQRLISKMASWRSGPRARFRDFPILRRPQVSRLPMSPCIWFVPVEVSAARLYSEYDIEVAKIARVVSEERVKAGLPTVPVKLIWSREDDIAHDDYRPAGYHFFKAGIDATGKLTAFRDFVPSAAGVSPAGEFPNGFVPNFQVSTANITPFTIPTGAMRAPSTNGISFVMQSFIDEIAVAAGKDPLQYRLDLLNSPVAPPAAPAAPGGGWTPRGGGAPAATGPTPGYGGLTVANGNGAPFNAARAKGVLEAVRDMSTWKDRAKLAQRHRSGCVIPVCA